MSRNHKLHHLKGGRWARLRQMVFARDGHRCRQCGRPGRLECDHVVPIEQDPKQDPFALDGLQTLCRRCHIEKTANENRRPLTAAEADWKLLIDELVD